MLVRLGLRDQITFRPPFFVDAFLVTFDRQDNEEGSQLVISADYFNKN